MRGVADGAMILYASIIKSQTHIRYSVYTQYSVGVWIIDLSQKVDTKSRCKDV